MKGFTQRSTDDNGHAMIAILYRYAQFIVTMIAIIAAMYGASKHFATAADVDKKFSDMRIELRLNAAATQKQILEIELYKLRSSGKSDPATMAQIRQFETELDNVNAKIRDLEKENK